MQTGIKDGKVTIILSYEEWMEMSQMIDRSNNSISNAGRDPLRSKLAADIFEQASKLDVEFAGMVAKEMEKIPTYLKMIIAEDFQILDKKENV